MPTVQFKANGVNIGVPITQPPYTMQWTPPSSGSYTITYEVTRDNGTKANSKPRALSVRKLIALSNTQNLVGININGVADYFQPIFRDAAKQSRMFEYRDRSEMPAGLAADYPTLLPPDKKDANGYPLIPSSIYMWAGPPRRHGTYSCSCTGNTNVSCFGGTVTDRVYTAGTNTTTWKVVVTDQGSSACVLSFDAPITNLKMMRPTTIGGTTPYTDDKLFTDEYLAAVTQFQGFRTLDFRSVNASSESSWNDRTMPQHWSQNQDKPISWLPHQTSDANGRGFGFAGRGCSWEYTFALANEAYAFNNKCKSIWVNVPVLADDNYIQQMLTLARDTLNPNIELRIEFGNENWNYAPAFFHAVYNTEKAEQEKLAGSIEGLDGTGGAGLAWRRQAKRTVDIAKFAIAIFGEAALGTRVFPVLQWQQQNAQGTASLMLNFLESIYFPATNDTSPVSRYIKGFGGSAYYAPENENPAINIDNIWNMNTFNPVEWSTKWLQVDLHWVTAFSVPDGLPQWDSYEGGSSMDRAEPGHTFNGVALTQAQINSIEAVKREANWHPKMQTLVESQHDLRSQHGGRWLFYLALGGVQGEDEDYQWSHLKFIDNFDTPKVRATTNLQSRNKAAITFGRLPGTFDGKQWDITNRGFGDQGPGNQEVLPQIMYGYTFRVATPGNYNFSLRANATSTWKLYLGSITLAPSVSATASTFTTPVSFNCPNAGLYCFRIRNIGASGVDVEAVRIEAAT